MVRIWILLIAFKPFAHVDVNIESFLFFESASLWLLGMNCLFNLYVFGHVLFQKLYLILVHCGRILVVECCHEGISFAGWIGSTYVGIVIQQIFYFFGLGLLLHLLTLSYHVWVLSKGVYHFLVTLLVKLRVLLALWLDEASSWKSAERA